MYKNTKNAALLDSAIAFTQSSFAYQDPFIPRGGVVYSLQNKLKTFMALRTIENEFIDFKTY